MFGATILAFILALGPFAVFAVGAVRAAADAPKPPPLVVINAFFAMAGWFYVLQPYRGAAAVAVGQLRHSWTARDFWFNYPWPDGPAPALMAGFLGWYIHMSTVAWVRLYRNDIASAKIHGRFLSRALMIFGFALVLSPVPHAVSLPLAFLLGIFPFALPSLVTGMLESLGLKAKSGDFAEGDLIALPGLSRLDVRRLHEEGIETLAQLATSNPEELKKALPMYGDLPEHWIKRARDEVEPKNNSPSETASFRLAGIVSRLALEHQASFVKALSAYLEEVARKRQHDEAERRGPAVGEEEAKLPKDAGA